jgi:hypothetical protein
MESASQLADGLVCIQQCSGGVSAESDDNLRLHRFQLPLEVWQATDYLVRAWVAVVRRTAFQYVAYENILAIQSHRVYYFVEQFSGSSDEWSSLGVLVGTWCFADKDNPRSGIAFAWDSIFSCFA